MIEMSAKRPMVPTNGFDASFDRCLDRTTSFHCRTWLLTNLSAQAGGRIQIGSDCLYGLRELGCLLNITPFNRRQPFGLALRYGFFALLDCNGVYHWLRSPSRFNMEAPTKEACSRLGVVLRMKCGRIQFFRAECPSRFPQQLGQPFRSYTRLQRYLAIVECHMPPITTPSKRRRSASFTVLSATNGQGDVRSWFRTIWPQWDHCPATLDYPPAGLFLHHLAKQRGGWQLACHQLRQVHGTLGREYLQHGGRVPSDQIYRLPNGFFAGHGCRWGMSSNSRYVRNKVSSSSWLTVLAKRA